MKLNFCLFAGLGYASHYRGGTYQIKPLESFNKLRVTATHTWRRDNGGYRPELEKNNFFKVIF